MTLLAARRLNKTYNDGHKEIAVLKGIDLQVSVGEMSAIIGASGSGKTTLLQVCGTLARPSSGELFFNGENLLEKNSRQLAVFRNRRLGFIFQFHHLLPEFTTVENVMMPGLIAGLDKMEIRAKSEELLDQVELNQRLDHKVGNLSGGEQQRTALARALVMQPKLLLADEPTGNLDSRSGGIVFNLLQSMCRKRSLAVIMVTHNLELAAKMDTVHTLRDGILEA